MKLPGYVLSCVRALEAAGFQAWAVGGCVRDACLGREPHDYDLCTDALPRQTAGVFSDHTLILAGEKHGTVGVVCQGQVVEITTFRREGDYPDSRHPRWVEFVPELREDLARRDFTVNAMAYSPERGLADPFGGREDLARHVLRAVGDPRRRFTEDALRILRGIRFSARFGLTPEPQTLKAMEKLAPRVRLLAPERIFDELCKLLPVVTSEDLLRFGPILGEIIPELKPTLGFDQRNPHHRLDLFSHIAQVVQGVPPTLPLRWAALLHDIGKMETFTVDAQGCGHFYGHAQAGAAMARRILTELKAPTALRERVVLLVEQHMTYPAPEKKQIRRRMSRLGEEAFFELLALQEADTGGKGWDDGEGQAYFDRVRELARQIRQDRECLSLKDLAVNGHDLLALGLKGRSVGLCLNRLLDLVLEEQVPNTREGLLAAVNEMRPELPGEQTTEAHSEMEEML